MLVPAPSSLPPTCTGVGSNMTCPSQAQFEMHPSEESDHPTRIRRHRDPPFSWWGEESSFTGWALSKPKGERGFAPPDFLHRLQYGSGTLWLFNSKTCLPQVMQKNGTLLLWAALSIDPINRIVLNWDGSKSASKLHGDQSNQCACMDPPARGTGQGHGGHGSISKTHFFHSFFFSQVLPCLLH